MNKKVIINYSLEEYLLIKNDIRMILNKLSLIKELNKKYIDVLINKLNMIDNYDDNKYFILNDLLYGLFNYLYHDNYNLYYDFDLINKDLKLILEDINYIEDYNNKYICELINKLNNKSNDIYDTINNILFSLISYLYHNNYNLYYFLLRKD